MVGKRSTSLLTPPLTPCMSRLHIDSPDYEWESVNASQLPTTDDNSAVEQRDYRTATEESIRVYNPNQYRLDNEYRHDTASGQRGTSPNAYPHWTDPNKHVTDAQQQSTIPGFASVIDSKNGINVASAGAPPFATSMPHGSEALTGNVKTEAATTAPTGDFNDNNDDEDDDDDDMEEQSGDEDGGDEGNEEGEQSKPKRPAKISDSLIQKRRMKRFRLNRTQTRFLMEEFAKYQHPDAALRQRLARQIPGLTARQVQVWFQNRRAKLKRTMDNHQQALRSRATLTNAASAAVSASHSTTRPQHSGSARGTTTIAPNIPGNASMSHPQIAPAGSVLSRVPQRYPPLTMSPGGGEHNTSSMAHSAGPTNPGFGVSAREQQQTPPQFFFAVADPTEYASFYPPTSHPWFDHRYHETQHHTIGLAEHQQSQVMSAPTKAWPTGPGESVQPFLEQERRHTLPVDGGSTTIGAIGGAEGAAPLIFPPPTRRASFPDALGSIYDSPSVHRGSNREDSLSRTYSHETAFGAIPPPGTLPHVYDEEGLGGTAARDLFEYDDATGTMRPRMTYSDFLHSLQQSDLHAQQQQNQQQPHQHQ